ncbi:hypothetical protein GCM10010274_54770 [Streptomyces lavendofoliae]|uniref:DUF11 domain-containing protein n=1 Tax=Streptomyces lavendofoliae TaxID=67314 RepID=A0A918I2K1_9ACTN|nr:hypothetical protein GCM10010274_54770 [Streptomyces lavendofoliae]
MTTPTPLRTALVNGSFEEPSGVERWELVPDASQTQAPRRVPGWLTTAPDHRIELWRSGNAGVPAPDGTQFAELNANSVSTLYQDLPTTPGTTLYWRLYHRGTAGQDTMALDIGAPGAVVEQRRFTDGNTAWGYYVGTYTVPAGQTTTRFALRSVAAAGGNPRVGNLVDGVFFGTAPLVVLTKSAIPEGPLEVGDVITYRVTARNEGGSAAENLVLTDAIPAGTTYLPGSLRIVEGPNTGAKTDEAGDDQAYFDAQDNRVVFRLGSGATSGQGGSLPSTETVPEGTTAEYRVTIDEASAGGRVTNTATATYENRLGPTPEPLTATSNEAVTEVRAAADLRVVKSADATTVTVGQTVTYRITIRNTGPNQATGATVTDRLPDNLAFLSAAATAGSYDPATGRWTVGDLADGATATLTLRAKATQAGPLTNTATADADETDPRPGNNTDTVTICVENANSCGAECTVDLDPRTCNSLTQTPQGLLAPRTVLSGIAPGGTVGRSRSIDIDVTDTGGRNCPDTWSIGARLSPISGEVHNSSEVNLPRTAAWRPTGAAAVLPEAGIYEVTATGWGQICAVAGPHTNLWVSLGLRIDGQGVIGSDLVVQHQFTMNTGSSMQACVLGQGSVTRRVRTTGRIVVRAVAALSGPAPTEDSVLRYAHMNNAHLFWHKISD